MVFVFCVRCSHPRLFLDTWKTGLKSLLKEQTKYYGYFLVSAYTTMKRRRMDVVMTLRSWKLGMRIKKKRTNSLYIVNGLLQKKGKRCVLITFHFLNSLNECLAICAPAWENFSISVSRSFNQKESSIGQAERHYERWRHRLLGGVVTMETMRCCFFSYIEVGWPQLNWFSLIKWWKC